MALSFIVPISQCVPHDHIFLSKFLSTNNFVPAIVLSSIEPGYPLLLLPDLLRACIRSKQQPPSDYHGSYSNDGDEPNASSTSRVEERHTYAMGSSQKAESRSCLLHIVPTAERKFHRHK